MRFTAEAWSRIAPIRAAIHDHPFVRELAAGRLPREAFRHYMIQDGLYLQGYARVLALAGAKAPGPDEILEFSRAAEVAIIVERSLHADYFARFGVAPDEAERAERAPTCQAYVDFMLGLAATDGYAVLTAAILPCFWIYWDVGAAIKSSSAPDNFYQAWIDTYAAPEFAAATERVKEITDSAHENAGPAERSRMQAAFVQASRYEWMFWDAAYRREAWPI